VIVVCNFCFSSGNFVQIGSSGDSAQIGSSGYSAKIGSSGEDCVISAIGINSTIKAKKGSWIILAQYKFDKTKQRQIPVCVKSAIVDGKKIKEDIFYKLENKKFVEVRE
jgi:hypothetical protein